MTDFSTCVVPKLKHWNSEKKFTSVNAASTSHDGRFIAVKVDEKVLVVIHDKCFTEDILLSETKEFVWGTCNWSKTQPLDRPTVKQFLFALDEELSITIFEVGADNYSFSHSIVTLVGSSILLTVPEFEEIKDVRLISAEFDNTGRNYVVNCLVNEKYFVQLSISKAKEPVVDNCVLVYEEDWLGSNGISKTVHKEKFIFFLSNNLVLFVLSLDVFEVKVKINIQERLVVYDVHDFNVISNPDGGYMLVFLDESLQMHFLNLKEIPNTTELPLTTDRKWPNIWNYRLRQSNIGQQRRRHPKKSGQSLLYSVPPDVWMNNYRELSMVVSNNTVLMLLEPKVKEPDLQQCFVAYNISKNSFQSIFLDSNVCLCNCENPTYPTLLVSNTDITIPAAGTKQEQLIDTIIQFSDISKAEMICKANNWDQFSIPLHTLEVGLQHRQVDTVAFFLKSREKVFTRYWKSRSELSTSFSGAGSPSKSFSSQRSYSEAINSDEMIAAIDMLLKAVSSSSKGKHKQTFFESLHNLVTTYFNHLIQDAIIALQMESYIHIEGQGREGRLSISESSFNFLQNIPESMKYITSKLLELRKYLTAKAMLTSISDEVDGSMQQNAQQDSLEDMLISGNIAPLQKLLFTRSGVCSGTFESLIEYGLQVVQKYLKLKEMGTSETILLNLGLNPQTEIKKIYMATFERTLRNTLFPYLKNHHLLSQEDFADSSYLLELEEIYKSEDFTVVLQNHSYKWSTVTGESGISDKGSMLELGYSHLSMEHVSRLDQHTRRQIIVEGRFINSAMKSIKSEDCGHFWKFLLRHNQIPMLLEWLSTKTDDHGSSKETVFQSLPETLLNLNDFLPDYTKEVLLNTLVKLGYYPNFLLEDMSLFIKYLTQTGRLFAEKHPILCYKQELSEDERVVMVKKFNGYFTKYCEQNDLVLLLWKFITHYKLDSNVIPIDDSMKSWLPFILSFHGLFSKKEHTEETLFKTFTDNATYLTTAVIENKSKDVNLNGLVVNNQAIIALSIALVCRKSAEEILPEAETKTAFAIEKDLLQSALKAFPKVFAALYSDNSDSDNKDVSMYRLLQDNTQLEIRYWFGWQKDNSLAVKEDTTLAQLPHFSNAFLSERYAFDVKLSYDYYLEQARPMYAYLIFMKNHTSYESKDRACNLTYKLAIENFNFTPISASCVLFLELLDGPHQLLKIDIKASILITKFWNKRVSSEKKSTPKEIKSKLVDLLLTKRSTESLMNVLKYLEECTEVAIHENKDIERFSYEAVCQWQLVVRFCRVHQLPLTTCYIKSCCKTDNWLQLFLFIHLYQFPADQVLHVIEDAMTNNSLKEHLLAIIKKSNDITAGKTDKRRKISKEIAVKAVDPIERVGSLKKNHRAQFYSKLGTAISSKENKDEESVSKGQPLTSTPKKEDRDSAMKEVAPLTDTSTTDITMLDVTRYPDQSQIPDKLIDLLLQCDEHKLPWKKLLGFAVATFNPLLAVLAACYENSKHSECLCIWLICSVSDDLKSRICHSLLDLEVVDSDAILILRNHRWSPEDILIIVKCLLGEGVKYVTLICQGFIIFRKADPLLYLTQFMEAFLYDQEESHTLSLLAEFQTEYKAFRSRNIMGKTFDTENDLYLCEDFSLQCLLLLIEQCQTTYHAYKLLKYLADSKYGFTFDRHVPNFMLAKQTAEIIYPTGVAFSVQRLCTTDIEDFDEEVHTLYTKLLERSAFEEAFTFAKLHNLPESEITIHKVSHELEKICLTQIWGESLEARCSFWSEADRTFNEMNCSPEIVAQFFEKQALQEDKLISYEERTALLQVAIKWYKGCKQIDQKKLSQIEKKVWLFKIRSVKATQQTGILPPKITLNDNTSESIFSIRGQIERKCSDVSYIDNFEVTELIQNEEFDYLFDDLLDEDSQFTLSDLQEEQAFNWLVGNLLDDLHITEARKVASYFKKTTTDLEIVLTAIRLAQGQLAVERCSDTIKAILAGTTSRHISVSGILERSGSFSRPESFTKHIRTSGASDVMVDFVFIEEVQNALEKLTIRINHGKKCCQQVLICFKAANILSIPYEDVVNDDCMNVLRKMLETKFDHRKQLAKQFIKAFHISADEVSTFIAELILSWVRIMTGEAEMISEAATLVSVDESKPPNDDDILGLIQLAENSSLVGSLLLEEAANISSELVSATKIAKLTYQVELLIYAHYCFTITCDMEGIAGVLRIAHHCTKCLAKRNQYSLMVRLLTGIGRFREMFYVIETLYNQHHFEVLCRKGKGDAKESQLKMALLDFMRKYHPEDIENLNMISVGFGMYREAAQHLEKQGLAEIERIRHDLKGGSKELVNTLEEIRKTFLYAANNYSKEECLYLEQSCTRLAHLAKLQIQLLTSGVQVLGLTKLQLQEFLNSHTDFIEAMIVADCYDFRDPGTWTEPLYRIVILKGNFGYLDQFQNFFQLTPTIVTNVAMRFRSDRNTQTPNNMKKFLNRLRDVRSKIKIARELNFTDIEKQLLEGSSGVYLRDHMF